MTEPWVDWVYFVLPVLGTAYAIIRHQANFWRGLLAYVGSSALLYVVLYPSSEASGVSWGAKVAAAIFSGAFFSLLFYPPCWFLCCAWLKKSKKMAEWGVFLLILSLLLFYAMSNISFM